MSRNVRANDKRVIEGNIQGLQWCDDRIWTHLLSNHMSRMGMSLVLVLKRKRYGGRHGDHHGAERPKDLTKEDRHNDCDRESLKHSLRHHKASISSLIRNGKGTN